MVKKAYSRTGRFCRVTFELPSGFKATSAALLGEFNQWNAQAHPMQQRKDGRFSTTISLEAGKAYRFKYLLDGQRWENESDADKHVPNSFGTEDSLLKL